MTAMNQFDARRTAPGVVAATASLVLLTIGLAGPFIRIETLASDETKGILTGIGALWDAGQRPLSVLILLLSVVFPFAKLAFVLAASTAAMPLSMGSRKRLAAWVAWTAKWSMLDVFVVAILVVAAGANGLGSVSVLWAAWVFMAAIGLSAYASSRLASTLEEAVPSSTIQRTEESSMVQVHVQGSRVGGVFGGVLLALAIAMASVGAWIASSQPPRITRIMLLSKPGIGLVLDDPDLYLVLRDTDGRTWRSSTASNAVIGDGLWFDVPFIEIGNRRGFDPALIAEVEVWDENTVFSNAMLDRFRLSGGSGGGQKYRIEVERSTDWRRWLPWALSLIAVPVGGLGVLQMVTSRRRARVRPPVAAA